MNDLLDRLEEYESFGVHPAVVDEAIDEIVRLRNILRAPLSSAELKLVDKHCEWEGFRHAWNAVLKSRLGEMERV